MNNEREGDEIGYCLEPVHRCPFDRFYTELNEDRKPSSFETLLSWSGQIEHTRGFLHHISSPPRTKASSFSGDWSQIWAGPASQPCVRDSGSLLPACACLNISGTWAANGIISAT